MMSVVNALMIYQIKRIVAVSIITKVTILRIGQLIEDLMQSYKVNNTISSLAVVQRVLKKSVQIIFKDPNCVSKMDKCYIYQFREKVLMSV